MMRLDIDLHDALEARVALFAGQRGMTVPQVLAVLLNSVQFGDNGVLELQPLEVGEAGGRGPAWARKRLAAPGLPPGQAEVRIAQGPEGVERHGHDGLSDPRIPLTWSGRERALRRATWFPPQIGDLVTVQHRREFDAATAWTETYEVAPVHGGDSGVVLRLVDDNAPTRASGAAGEEGCDEGEGRPGEFAEQEAAPEGVLLPLWERLGPCAVAVVRDGVIVHDGPRDEAAEMRTLGEMLGLPADGLRAGPG